MTHTVIFLGPTLPVAEARARLDAIYLPPVAQGDVYRAALGRPHAIGIIDGYFERVPAVWHKEILYAMSQGVHVFGASSMGALRAAELDAFGMVGVGKIFEDFRSGLLTDDDEVTIVHGAAEDGYRRSSVAMVDIRATLELAQRQQIISEATQIQMIALAKALHYPLRSFERLLADGARASADAAQLNQLADWLKEHRVDQKREDAFLLLDTLARLREDHPKPKHVEFAFEHTDAFEQVVQRHDLPLTTERQNDTARTALLEELRLDPPAYAEVSSEALARALALRIAAQRGLEIDDQAYRTRVQDFRREHALFAGEATLQFIAAQDLDRPAFEGLMRDEAKVGAIGEIFASEVDRQRIERLRLRGAYAQLRERARYKAALLAQHGYENPDLDSAASSQTELVAWYFREVCESVVPDDLETFIRSHGYHDSYAFLRALCREYLYRKLAAGAQIDNRHQCTATKHQGGHDHAEGES